MPTLVFTEEDNYMSRKMDIKVWKMITDLDKKQGPTVCLTMARWAWEAVREIPAIELGENDEFGKIIHKLYIF